MLMFPMKLVPPAFVPAILWMNTGAKTMEMLAAASQVIAHRTCMMMNAGAMPSAADRAEFTLMWSEKVAAFADVAGRAAQGWMKLNEQLVRAWLGALSGPQKLQANIDQATALSSAAARLSGDLLHPVHGKATANARRLAAQARRRIISGGR